VDIYEVQPRKNKRGARHLAGILIALDGNNVFSLKFARVGYFYLEWFAWRFVFTNHI
jgi:hypothetical protein